ncbi:MAG: DNA polymerase I [Thermosulfidibacteraceae bacterium]
MKEKKLFIVDGSNYIYRAFYALPFLSTTKGLPTNSVYGFTRMITKLLKEKRPEYMAVVFDEGKSKVRTEIYREYKSTRLPMPPDLQVQIPYVHAILKALEVPIVQVRGVEADDIIGTLTKRALDKGYDVFIVSPDKDLLQLVSSSKAVVFDPMKEVLYDENKVIEKYGLPPDRLPIYFALVGDKSDNIPGVKGIGEKTAKEIASKFTSLDEIYKRITSFPPALRKRLVEGKEDAYLSESLFRINTDLDLKIDIDSLKIGSPNLDELVKIYSELEFRSLLKELSREAGILKEVREKRENMEVTESKRANMPIAFIIPGIDGLSVFTEGRVFSVKKARELFELLDNVYEVVAYDSKRVFYELLKEGIETNKTIYDILIALHLINPLMKPDGIDEVIATYVGGNGISFNLLTRLWRYINEKMSEKGLINVYRNIELPLTKVLAEMELRGIKIDRVKLKEIGRIIDSKMKELTERIYSSAGTRFNINSPKQLAFILFEKLRLPPVKKTKTGYSTDVEVLEELTKYHELPSLLLEYRQLAKLKSTYINGLLSMVNPETGRIHTTYNQIVTITGRLSSSEPNLQNIPIKGDYGKLIRTVFTTDSGYLLVSFDYSQIELRVLAELSKDEMLIGAFERGEDIHLLTAMEVFQVKKEEVTPELRRKAKVVNFGIIYGMSPYGLSKELGITVEEAKNFIDIYFKKYPGVRRFIDEVVEEARKKGLVRTYFGRIRPIPEFYSLRKDERELAKRIAINTPIQGTSAEIIKLAMIKVYRYIKENKLPAYMVLQVHDELVFEVKEEIVEEFTRDVKEIMEKVVPEFSVPLVVDIHVGDSWSKE